MKAVSYDDMPDDVWDSFARDCRCCPVCSNVICAGVLAGGLCDQACRCDDDDRDYSDDEEISAS